MKITTKRKLRPSCWKPRRSGECLKILMRRHQQRLNLPNYSREQYGMLGSSHIPMVSTTSPSAQRTHTAARTSPGHGMFGATTTTILLPYSDDVNERDASQILAAMPSRRDSDILVEECEFRLFPRRPIQCLMWSLFA